MYIYSLYSKARNKFQKTVGNYHIFTINLRALFEMNPNFAVNLQKMHIFLYFYIKVYILRYNTCKI